MAQNPFDQFDAQVAPRPAAELKPLIGVEKPAEKPTETFRPATKDEKASQGLDPNRAYQVNTVTGEIKDVGGQPTAKPAVVDPTRPMKINSALDALANIRRLAEKSLSVGEQAGRVRETPIIGAIFGQNRADLEGALSQIEGALIQDQLAILSQMNPQGVASLANSETEARRMASSIANLDPNQSLPEFLKGVERAEKYYQDQLARVGGERKPVVTGEGTSPALRVAQGETYSTDQDIAIATELNGLWKGGATVEQVNQRSIELTGKPLDPGVIETLRKNGRAVNFVPASSGVREGGGPGPLAAAAAGLFRGGSANLGEEAFGLIDPAAAAKLQAASEYAQSEFPMTAMAGELVGGIMSPLSRLGGRVPGVSGAVGREAASGAIYGGLYGAGEAEPSAGLSERLAGAAIGGLTGGAAGALGGKIAQRIEGAPQQADNLAPMADELPVPGAIGEVPTPPVSDMETVVDLARKATGRGPGRTAARRELARMAKINPAAQEAGDRLGVNLPVDVLSDDAQLLSLTGLARSQVGSEAETAWGRTVRDAIARSDAVMDELGATTDLAQLSDDVAARLNSSMDGLEKQAATLRDEVTAAFRPSDRVEASATKAALASIIDDLGGLEQAKKAFSPEERKLMAMLGEGDEAIQPTYAMIDRLRRDMGKAIFKGQGPWADADMAAVKRFYGALADDQLAFIEQTGGKELADKQRAANSLFTDMYSKREELVGLFGKDLDKGLTPMIRRSISSGAKGDASSLRKMLENVPEDLRGKALMSGLLAESTNRGAYGGFSFANFAKSYRGLRANAPVYKEFVKYLGPKGDQTLIDLYAISRRMVEAENKVLKTGKANQALVGQMNAESLLKEVAASAGGRAVANVATGATMGPIVAGGTTLASELAARAGGATRTDKLHKLLSSDDFRATMEKLAMGGNTEGAANRLASSRAFIEWSKSVPGLRNFASRKEWIKTAFAQAGGNMAPEATTVSAEPTQ